jgi:NTP pyrophosphatase (non-canonical NTP hydrolase)
MADHPFTTDELLVLLIEECGEVIQAATKCLRFGFARLEPHYGINSEILAQEAGDLLGVMDALSLDRDIVEAYRKIKIAKAMRAKLERVEPLAAEEDIGKEAIGIAAE